MSNVPLPSSFDGDSEFYEENRWQKFSRRLREEPLIPLGCVATCTALWAASRSIKAGDHNRTNRMFRMRIYGQAFTLVAMVAGSMYWQTDRQKRKEFDAVIAERKAREKSEAWVKELEARDEEERESRAVREARRRGVGVQIIRDEMSKTQSEKEAKTLAGKLKAGSIAEDGTEQKKGVLDSVQWAWKK